MVEPEEIQTLLRQAIPDAEVTVQDLTGTGDHFQVIVLSSAFKGKALLEQHQMVYASLEPLKEKIHALTIKTKAL